MHADPYENLEKKYKIQTFPKIKKLQSHLRVRRGLQYVEEARRSHCHRGRVARASSGLPNSGADP